MLLEQQPINEMAADKARTSGNDATRFIAHPNEASLFLPCLHSRLRPVGEAPMSQHTHP